MATRKRRSTKRRRVHTRARAHNPINPTRRRRRRTHTVHARRRHNPVRVHHRRRHTRRRRNPSGATGEILNFTVAGIAQGIATPIVGGFAGRFLPFGQYNPPIIAFGTGWLLSKVFGMFGFTRRFSHAAYIFGAATAAMQLLQPIVARTLAGAGQGAQSGMGWRRGMSGIAAVHGIPPLIMPPPAPPAHAGMSGVASVPGVWNK